jgi:outer membrane protein TolC
VDAALSALGAADARLSALEAAVAQGVEVARIEALALAQGAGVQTDYIAAEAEVARTRAALTDAIVAAQRAHIELARATGELTPLWLTRNLEAGR